MYIRQMTLFSFEEIIKFQEQTKLELILEQIDVSALINELKKDRDSKGPRGYSPRSLIYSLIAMQVEKINSIKALVLHGELGTGPFSHHFLTFPRGAITVIYH